MMNTNKRLSPPKYLSDLSEREKQFMKSYLQAPVQIQLFVDMYLKAPRYIQDALAITINAIKAHQQWQSTAHCSARIYTFKKPPERKNVGGND